MVSKVSLLFGTLLFLYLVDQTISTLKMFSPKNRKFLTGAFGFILGLLGLLYGIFWNSMFSYLLEKAMILRPNSKIFELWAKPPLQVAINFYLFNWTNQQDFNNLSSKPILQELGPYRFYEIPEKYNIKWHSENASVTYSRRSKYYFDAANSNGSLDDQIITINSLAVGVSARAKQWSPMRRTLADLALRVYHSDIALKKSIGELLFDGFDDTLMNLANAVPPSVSSIHVPFDKFGYCYLRNSSSFSSTFNIHTGADTLKNYGKLHTWNYRNATQYFPSDCAKVHGSTGELQPPYLQKNRSIDIFVPDFCRSITLDYVEAIEVEGIQGFKYAGGERLVDNGTRYPENACYCNGECVPSGLFNISSCWYQLSLFMSYPHFYKADPYYLEQFKGLQPNKDLHEMYLVLEPRTSMVLDVGVRFQANVLVEPTSHFKIFRRSRKIFFPLLWFEATARITPDLSNYIKNLSLYILCGQIFGGFCFAVGLIIAMWYPLANHFKRQLNVTTTQKDQNYINKMDFVSLPEGSPLLDRVKKSISRENDKTTMDAISSNGSWETKYSGRSSLTS